MRRMRNPGLCGGIILLAVLLWPATMPADPGSVVWSGGSVRLVAEHPSVALTSERIVIEPGIPATEITVELEFHNEGDAVTAQMGFPTLPALPGPGYYYVRDFSVEVDGKLLPVTRHPGTIDLPTAANRRLPYLDGKRCTWYLFNVPFQAGEKRKMRVRYDQWAQYGSPEWFAQVPYVLATGGTWRGGVGEVRVEVRLGDRLNYHAMVLKGDDKALEMEEREDTLVWTAKDYDGTPALLHLSGRRGPARFRVDDGVNPRQLSFDKVLYHHGRLLVEADALADILCVPDVKCEELSVLFIKEGERARLEGRPFDAYKSYDGKTVLKTFVDPAPAFAKFDAVMTEGRDERGDAVVDVKLYVTRGFDAARQTAELREQKSEYRIRCLDLIAGRYSDRCAGVSETICGRAGEDPDVMQKALQHLSERNGESCRKLCREILARKAEHPAVMLWALGYLADEKPDDAAVERAIARVPGADAQERTKALAELALSSRYDPPVRGGAMALARLDPLAAREGLVAGICVCPNWMDRTWRSRNAGLALRMMRMEGTRETLLAAVKSRSNGSTAAYALVALGFLGDDAAIPYLVETALDPKPPSRDIPCGVADALACIGTPGSLEACAQVMERSRDREVISRALKGFDIATAYWVSAGKTTWFWYEPRPAPDWARTMTVEEACRVAAPLLERLAVMEHLKDCDIGKRLAYVRAKQEVHHEDTKGTKDEKRESG